MGWISLFFHGLLGHYSLQVSRPNDYGLSPLKPWAKIKVSCFIQGSTIAMQCWVTSLPCKNLQINIFKYFWLIILNKLGAEKLLIFKVLNHPDLTFQKYFIFNYVHARGMCVYVQVCKCECKFQRKSETLDPLDLELQAIGSYLICALVIEIRSSDKSSTLYCCKSFHHS